MPDSPTPAAPAGSGKWDDVGRTFADLVEAIIGALRLDDGDTIDALANPEVVLPERINGLANDLLRERAAREAAERELYEFKVAAAGGEDAPGSAECVTVADVNRWRGETRTALDDFSRQVTDLRAALAASTEREAGLRALVEELLELNGSDECCAEPTCQSACCGFNHDWIAEQRQSIRSRLASLAAPEGGTTDG